MNKYIVAIIHNNSLGKVVSVCDENHGKDIARGLAEDQFLRGLTDEEIDDLNDKLEIYNDEDSDNIYSFSVGIVEYNDIKEWEVSDISNGNSLGRLEFLIDNGSYECFELVETKTRIVFGGCCNTGFIESGYIEREDVESLEEIISELLEDLKCYYNNGREYCTRIVCNERM